MEQPAGEIKGATLVVCPAAAMLQWRNEILRFTEPGPGFKELLSLAQGMGPEFEHLSSSVGFMVGDGGRWIKAVGCCA